MVFSRCDGRCTLNCQEFFEVETNPMRVFVNLRLPSRQTLFLGRMLVAWQPHDDTSGLLCFLYFFFFFHIVVFFISSTLSYNKKAGRKLLFPTHQLLTLTVQKLKSD